MAAAARAGPGDPVDVAAVLGERSDHLVPDFIAAGPDRGTDRDDEVVAFRAINIVQARDRSGRDAGERSAPARVNGGGGPRFRRPEEERHAVRALDDETDTDLIGQKPIAVLAPVRSVCLEHADFIPVHLPHRGEPRKTEGGRELLTVRLASAASPEPARPEGESMGDARFAKSWELKQLEPFEGGDSNGRLFQARLSAGETELRAFSYCRSRSSGFIPLSMWAQGSTSSRGFWRWI